MEQNWTTETEDMQFAQSVIEQYAALYQSNTFELFELFVDTSAKKMGFCLAKWVIVLARHFHHQYGAEHGDFVVRQIIAKYMVKGETLH